jgi:hypothetical protein
MTKKYFLIFATLLLQACAEEPIRYIPNQMPNYGYKGESRFELLGDTIHDKITDLYWKRCLEGEKWDGTSCTEFADIVDWNYAKGRENNLTGYRLPTKIELLSVSRAAPLNVWGEISRPDHYLWSGEDVMDAANKSSGLKKWKVSNIGKFIKSGNVDGIADVALVRLVCEGAVHRAKLLEAEQRRLAEENARKKQAEENARKKQAEENASKQQAEELALKKQAEEEARKQNPVNKVKSRQPTTKPETKHQRKAQPTKEK